MAVDSRKDTRLAAIPARRDDDIRFTTQMDVTLHVADQLGGYDRIAAMLIDFSHHGFCVRVPDNLRPCGEVLLELPGWPPVSARVAWSHERHAGCQFFLPLRDDRYEAMLLSREAVSQDGLWYL